MSNTQFNEIVSFCFLMSVKVRSHVVLNISIEVNASLSSSFFFLSLYWTFFLSPSRELSWICKDIRYFFSEEKVKKNKKVGFPLKHDIRYFTRKIIFQKRMSRLISQDWFFKNWSSQSVSGFKVKKSDFIQASGPPRLLASGKTF